MMRSSPVTSRRLERYICSSNELRNFPHAGLPLLRKIFTGHYRFMVTCQIVTLFTEILGIGRNEEGAETESQSETA